MTNSSFDHKVFLKQLSTLPGVYQMLDSEGEVIYVGKAKNLKNRLSSYFVSPKQLAPKTRSLVSVIADIKLTITQSEQEALILECNLIKKHRPRYNILMRDDKSYPYIKITHLSKYPRIDLYRGKKNNKAKFFGPYPSVTAVRATLKLLQKLFKLRQCTDSFFNQRERPCLQYQINRCSAPCMKFITENNYFEQVKMAELFLQGKSEQVISGLQAQMEQAANNLEFEQAASYRDLIEQLRAVQSKQYIDLENKTNYSIDVFAFKNIGLLVCITQLVIREGKVIASQSHFPKIPVGTKLDAQSEAAEIIRSFLAQYYLLDKPSFGVPKEIILNIGLSAIEKENFTRAIFDTYQITPKIKNTVKAERAKCLAMAELSAKENLSQKRAQLSKQNYQLESLQKVFELASLPERIECFDISHTQGEATIGSCVVFGAEGPLKEYYRRYNIENITPGDDYAAMRKALYKRYTKRERLPDLILIDGGKGQLKIAKEVMLDLELDHIALVGVAKGPDRKAGLEKILFNNKFLQLEPDSLALLLIQQIRDEAHRFAIMGHRAKRSKQRTVSTLENIPGIGAKRRRELLKHFGGLQGVMKASIEDLASANGVSKQLAENIYLHLHGDVSPPAK